jgi:hypothetical protein
MQDKVKYTCKNCGWETSIRAEWADIKPKRCMNKKCNTNFQAKPKDLIITPPKKKEAPKKEKPDEEKSKTVSKPKPSRKSFKPKEEEKKAEDSE